MTSVLIVGGTGLLGDELVRQSLAHTDIAKVAATWRVTAPETTADFEPVTWHQLDITDHSRAAELISQLAPDLVFNAAYVKSGPNLPAVTGEAPLMLAEACQSTGARLVHLSSDVVFDGRSTTAYSETSPASPVNDYGRAKVQSELAVGPLGALVARSSIIYGGHRPEPQIALLEQAASGADISFFTDEVRNPIHVADLTAALLEFAFLDDPPAILHLAGADAVDRLTFARLLGAANGMDVSQLRGAPAPADSDRPRRVETDIALAQRLLTTKLQGVYERLSPK